MSSGQSLDVLLVSLGSTGGLRAADEELLGSLVRAGVHAELVRPAPPRAMRTLMLTDLAWAHVTRRSLERHPGLHRARALIYSTTTAALLWPRPGAIRFDAPAAANRPGRHGLWQRPLERRRLAEAGLLLAQSEGALHELGADSPASKTLVVPVPVEPSAHGDEIVQGRDIAAISYVSNPAKKGLDLILAAWQRARREGEQLVLAGSSESELSRLGYRFPVEGVSALPTLSTRDYRALLRRSRVYLCAARREDYGIAQMEALADGCMLVTTVSPGPYVALPLARELDERLVGDDLAGALRHALDEPLVGYAHRALDLLAPWRRSSVDRLVAERLLPRLLA
jgi:glycosyltransferase involved in cell wall biosynthesis